MKEAKLPNQSPKKPRKYLLRAVLAAVLLLLSLLAFVYRQLITDYITVFNFHPSADISAIASRAGLNEKGKFYLLASRTELDDREAFNKACGGLQNEKTVVIGCYTNPEKRIYVYDVTDERLDGVKETSAAHEMLHAAYDRLDQGEKNRVNQLIEQQRKLVTDPRLLEIIAFYEKSEPDSIVDELHSIFGTEIRNLLPGLETHYAQYFSNRLATVALKEKYEKVFTDLTRSQAQLVQDMNALAEKINAQRTAYEAALKTLNTDVQSFNVWAQSGSGTRAEYNSRRAVLQTRISALDAQRSAIDSEVDDYNAKKVELDKLNVQAETLNQSIDSKQLPSATKL